MSAPLAEISRHVWETKYRDAGEHSLDDTWRRIARALASVEGADRAGWEARFLALLADFRFLPGGRIQAGAGSGRQVTLFNCFVMGTIEDSIPGIFRALQEGAVTMQQGGGIGCDFSTLRPRGTRARRAGTIASGPVSFMRVWDAMCGTILSTGARRGAMMATLRCDHPDIEDFVAAKHQPGELRRFNLSVLAGDDFMAAARTDADWPLVFPAAAVDGEGAIVEREWPGAAAPVPCRVLRTVPARALLDRILRAAYDHAEPGVLFVDRINRLNNLGYRERISATNPCGEIPLPPYGACNLGSLNLARFVAAPFTDGARLDTDALAAAARVAVRLLDNVVDLSGFPLPQQAESARGARRIGLGITGLADALVMLGLPYDGERGRVAAAEAMREICHAAYRASAALAAEKGSFPFLVREKYLEAPFVQALPADIRDAIAADGVRNSHLTAIAPTGTISLLAGNVSSGLEPVFSAAHARRVLDRDGRPREFHLTDHALALWRDRGGRGLPPGFVTAAELPARAHLAMQAALQPFVDNAISKTINVPADCPFAEFREIYDLAYDQGLKGVTTFRPNPVTGAVLSPEADGAEAPHCCVLEREPD
ncbi:MAG: ribonucleoside-diphosphate reductase, adenosylcobalamin-dependent [Bradyrhizobiaceae bacterium]|nr:MAG: ribonucleoside-diphosphate reductase, adenosylcobalamin-dependent [Bradyrhizobiaceae bacterium]